eukprot:scaffold5627_cov158-Amphora_coffeaeformis.AAC.3
MQISPTYEIRVALIGYVSVGKTTVLNALFGAKYGEVNMNRTTALVNNFRICPRPHAERDDKEAKSKGDDKEEKEGSVGGMDKDKGASTTTGTNATKRTMAWATAADDPVSPAAALKSTTAENAKHRHKNTKKVAEKDYDVVLDEPLHRPLRDDTRLVIVDVPGINEAGTSSKYKDWVDDNWHTFDVVVVVLDGRQGVNTEEQTDLLARAKRNAETIKDVPLVFLLNKIDDAQDEHQKILVDEVCVHIQNVFGIGNRKAALERLLSSAKEKESKKGFSPFDDPTDSAATEAQTSVSASAKAEGPLSPFGFAQDRASKQKTDDRSKTSDTTAGGAGTLQTASDQPVAFGPDASESERPFVFAKNSSNHSTKAVAMTQSLSSSLLPLVTPSKETPTKSASTTSPDTYFVLGKSVPKDRVVRARRLGTYYSSGLLSYRLAMMKLSRTETKTVAPNSNPPFSAFSLDKQTWLPAVVSVSAMHAFLYRCGSRMTFDQFREMDNDFIEKIGKESYGRQWRRYSSEEQLQKAFEAVNDAAQCNDGIENSNFATFLKVLSFCIGDETNQLRILQKQVDINANRLAREVGYDLGKDFGHIYDMALPLLGNYSPHVLHARFWEGYRKKTAFAFQRFLHDNRPGFLKNLPITLQSYFTQLMRLGIRHETSKLVEETCYLVKAYVELVYKHIQYQSKTEHGGISNDLLLVVSSLLLAGVKFPAIFCTYFGDLKMILEERRIQILSRQEQKGIPEFGEGQTRVCEICAHEMTGSPKPNLTLRPKTSSGNVFCEEATEAVPFSVTSKTDGLWSINFQCITAMPQYESLSFEELRMAAYPIKSTIPKMPLCRFSPTGALSSPAPFGFTPALHESVFGALAPNQGLGSFGSTAPNPESHRGHEVLSYSCSRCNTPWINCIMWETRRCQNCWLSMSVIQPLKESLYQGRRVLSCGSCCGFWQVGLNGPWYNHQTSSTLSRPSLDDPDHYGYLVAKCCGLLQSVEEWQKQAKSGKSRPRLADIRPLRQQVLPTKQQTATENENKTDESERPSSSFDLSVNKYFQQNSRRQQKTKQD